jgi:hypothetical protein
MILEMANAFPTTARCLGCRYALRGLPKPVCPECGRSFDPHDPASYADGGRPPRWWRWARPPSNVHILICAMGTLFLMNGFSLPGGVMSTLGGLGCFLLPLIPLLGLALIMDYCVRWLLSRRARVRAALDEARASPGAAWRWFILPTCLTIVLSAAITDWPLFLRFQLSRNAFEDVVRTVPLGTTRGFAPCWVGLYYVRSIARDSSGDVGFEVGTAWWNTVGFQYGTAQAPVFDRVVFSRPLAQNWYVVEWKW